MHCIHCFVDILLCIGEILEILINLQYFLGFSLYILWNPWNPYISIFVFLSLVCVQVDSNFRSQREGSLFHICFRNNWYSFAYSFMLYCPLIRIWFFDLVCLDFNPNITFKSSVYCKSSDFPQYFWGFHPWILLNPWIC